MPSVWVQSYAGSVRAVSLPYERDQHEQQSLKRSGTHLCFLMRLIVEGEHGTRQWPVVKGLAGCGVHTGRYC